MIREHLVSSRSRRAPVSSGIRPDGRADPGSCRYSGLRSWLLRGCCIKPPEIPGSASGVARTSRDHSGQLPASLSSGRAPTRTETLAVQRIMPRSSIVAIERRRRQPSASDEQQHEINSSGDQGELQNEPKHDGQCAEPKDACEGCSDQTTHNSSRHPPKREACATATAPGCVAFWVPLMNRHPRVAVSPNILVGAYEIERERALA